MEKTAPEIAPTAAPLMNPLSVSWPIKAPVNAPSKVPTETQIKNKKFNLTNHIIHNFQRIGDGMKDRDEDECEEKKE